MRPQIHKPEPTWRYVLRGKQLVWASDRQFGDIELLPLTDEEFAAKLMHAAEAAKAPS